MLTIKQAELARFIRDYMAANSGITPSFQTMRDALGLRSKSTISRLVNGLEERGVIRRIPGRARAIEFVRYDLPEIGGMHPLVTKALSDYCARNRVPRDWVIETALADFLKVSLRRDHGGDQRDGKAERQPGDDALQRDDAGRSDMKQAG